MARKSRLPLLGGDVETLLNNDAQSLNFEDDETKTSP